MEDIVFTNDNVNAALIWFAAHVKNMRDNQKDYFKTRSKSALIASKESEKAIDKAIDQIMEVAEISFNR
ncbi:MAG: hypothetical protein AB9842_08290 [Bacteroidales bacterium]